MAVSLPESETPRTLKRLSLEPPQKYLSAKNAAAAASRNFVDLLINWSQKFGGAYDRHSHGVVSNQFHRLLRLK